MNGDARPKKDFFMLPSKSARSRRNSDPPDWNIGYTTREHLCLDLDNTSFFKTENLVKLLMCQYPFLGDALIMCSSKPKLRISYRPDTILVPNMKVRRHNYHVIFNNSIDYEMSCKIIEALAELDVIARDFTRIRQMRNDMTLRVSRTVNMQHTKPAPTLEKYVVNPHAINRGDGIMRYMTLRLCFDALTSS
jgi:hypothetical protein